MSNYLGSLGAKKPLSPSFPVAGQTQTAAPVSSNVGATSTTPVVSSPAKSAYVSSLAGGSTQTGSTATGTSASTGNTDTGSTQAGITGNATTPSGAVVNATTGASISTPAPDKNASYTDAYTKYIQSLTPTNAENTATTNLNNLNLQAQKDQDKALDSGETLGFASGEAARVAHNNSYAIDSAANTLNSLTGQRTATSNAAKARADFEKGLLDSSSADAKEKFSENLQTQTLAQNKLSSDRTFDENKKEFGLTYAQNAQKIAIDQQKANQTDPNSATATAANTSAATTSINLINSLLGNPSIGAISGVPSPTSLIPGTQAQLAKNQYNQVKGLLSLENRSKLKGQGAVSDFEGQMLESAASSLGRNLSDDEFKKQLTQVKGAIATSHGLNADVLLTDPATGKSQVVTSNSASIAEAIKDGLLVSYQ